MRWTDQHRRELANIYGHFIRRFGFDKTMARFEKIKPAAHKRVEQASETSFMPYKIWRCSRPVN